MDKHLGEVDDKIAVRNERVEILAIQAYTDEQYQ